VFAWLNVDAVIQYLGVSYLIRERKLTKDKRKDHDTVDEPLSE